jgi:hypothetical protein
MADQASYRLLCCTLSFFEMNITQPTTLVDQAASGGLPDLTEGRTSLATYHSLLQSIRL